MHRLCAARWATLGDFQTTLLRRHVLDACEQLDAMEEAEERMRARAKNTAAQGAGRR